MVTVGPAEASWPKLVAQLGQTISGIPDVTAITTLWWYGRLIANSDMHTGNLSFSTDAAHDTKAQLHLAPCYDMLPMLYAPLAGGEVPTRDFKPDLPLPTEKDEWLIACTAACRFWQTAARDNRVSKAFRAICSANAQALARLLDMV